MIEKARAASRLRALTVEERVSAKSLRARDGHRFESPQLHQQVRTSAGGFPAPASSALSISDSKARIPAARFGDPAEFGALCGCLGAEVTYITLRLWALTRTGPQDHRRSDAMAWSTPEVREVCVGMEVTSYLSAEM